MCKNHLLKIIFKLFSCSLYIGATSFGGGFVSLSLIKQTYSQKLKWISGGDMLDFSALAQAAPGSISINLSMLIGFKMAGILGAIACLLGSVIPPFLAITALYYFYDFIKGYAIINYLMRGMQAGVAAIILGLVIDLIKETLKEKELFSAIVLQASFIISFISSFLFDVSTVIYLVALSALAGFAYAAIKDKKRK